MQMSSAARLWGVRAHMHSLGTSAIVQRASAGPPSCLLSIPRWDPNWQLMYFWDAPLSLAQGDTISLDCTFDTSLSNTPVVEGPFTTNEMCFSYYYMTGLPAGG
jgi:hypothetical protein